MSRIPFELGQGATDPDQRQFVTSGRRFHLIELIGRGSFGDVYLADQSSDGGFRRRVVLKLLNADIATRRGASQQIRNEARILGLLVHRHIVGVLDLVRFEDRWAILMDYVPGADLERVLDALSIRQDEVFPVPAALEVGAAVCEALHSAIHTSDGNGGMLSVVHRDIKPSNIQLTPDGEVKVLDFGVARFSLDERTEPAKQVWIGTERYMSPERIRCEGDTPAGDVYAAAASVVELLLGRPLGRTPVTTEAHGAFVDTALNQLRARIDADPHTVEDILELLRTALHADPDRRPVAGALARSLEDLVTRVRGESLRQFSRRFVPRIDTVLGRKSVPANGTLREGTTSRNVLLDVSETQTPHVPPPHVHAPAPQVSPNRTPIREEGRTPTREEGRPASREEGRTPIPVPARVGSRPMGGIAPTLLPPAPPERRWLPVALHVGGVMAGAIGGVVIGPAIAVAVMLLPSRGVTAVVPAPVEALAPVSSELVVDVPPVSEDPFGRTLLGTPLFPGSRPDLVAVVINPATGAPAEARQVSFVVEDASRVEVTCGEVSAVGQGFAHVSVAPASRCRVDADWLGSRYSTELDANGSGPYRCVVQNRVLRCS